MTEPQISCDLPGFISLAEDDVCERQEQRERGNKLREELIVEMEGLRPGSVSLSLFWILQKSFVGGEIFRSHFEGKAVFK